MSSAVSGALTSINFIFRHPLNRKRPLAALGKLIAWQIACRIRPEIEYQWIDGAKLKIRRGMTGATGNVYCGLHEFVEMAFLLHLLRPDDLFLDIGANVGSYTVLASRVCGARTIAFEPDPEAARTLERNIAANNLQALATVRRIALGDHNGEVAFTTGRDTMNRVAQSSDHMVQRVAMARLDEVCHAVMPVLIKLDVEGYEERVLSGAACILQNPSLLAIQSELDTPDVAEILGSYGFKPSYYDPFSRKIAPTDFGLRVFNMLYIRDLEAVSRRVAMAPYRNVVGRNL